MSTPTALRHFFLGAASAALLLILCLAVFARVGGIELAMGNLVLRSQRGAHAELGTQIELGARAELAAPAPGQPQQAPVLPIQPGSGSRPRNLILFVGDGMGIGAVSAAAALLEGPGGGLHMMATPHVGLMRTWAVNDLATDSAASATAMATGRKTNLKMVGMLPDGRAVRNIFELARERGYATGVVTTTGLVDATPAAFTSHARHRDHYDTILEQMLASGTDVLVGGDWSNKTKVRENQRYQEMVDNLEDLATDRGFNLLLDPTAVAEVPAPLLALFPPRSDTGDEHGPELAVLTRRALELLATDSEGFVLVVECEITDTQAHSNSIAGTMAGVRELDDAVAVALEFISGRDDTLVLVTADHDTGGLAIVEGEFDRGRAEVRWATGEHTSQWVPMFAFGPGAEHFGGVFDNTWLAQWLAELLDLGKLPQMAENAAD